MNSAFCRDHAAFLSSLEVGCLTYKASAVEHKVAIRDGFAEVSDNVMTVLSEAAARPEDVDAEAARADLAQAQAKLEDLSVFDPTFADAEADRRWAEARLSLAK